MKDIILITGSTGLVATQLIKTLSINNEIWAISSRVESIKKDYAKIDSVKCFSNEQLLNGDLDLSIVNTVIQCAYTRNNDPALVSSASLFASKVFGFALRAKVKKVINVSTRSVYKEPKEGCLNKEEDPIYPNGAIGIGKYTIECMAEEMFKDSGISYTSIRLASVNEVKMKDVLPRPMNFFVDSMINGTPIKVISGKQVMSYIDPRDIADAVSALLSIDSSLWKPIYNIGTGWMATATLLDIAKKIVKIGVEKYNLPEVNISIEPREIDMRAGLDISKITADTGWTPKYGLDDMIVALYNMKLSK
jgi:nucleoside-diphosphate-sugar epimerase